MRETRQNILATIGDLTALAAPTSGPVEDTAEITGTTPNRKLWVNDVVTGERRLLLSTTDPNTPRITRDRHVIFESTSGTRHLPIAGGTPQQIYPTKTLSLNGDSLTAGLSTSRMATSLGITVTNLGIAGSTSTDVAIRQGGLQALLTVTGNQIPASGPVTVTAISPSTSYRVASSTSVPFTFNGTLAGIPGVLTHYSDQPTNLITFTRTSSGSVTSCPANTPFICTEGDAYTSWIQSIWVGRNNVNIPGATIADITRDITSMVVHLTPYSPEFLVIGITNGQNEPIGSTNYTAITTQNSAVATLYGKRFYDMWKDFIANGLAMASISPTAGDTAAIAVGCPPPSLMADNIHPNAAGFNVVADLITNKITALGWLAS